MARARTRGWREPMPGPATWADVGKLLAAYVEQGYAVEVLASATDPEDERWVTVTVKVRRERE